MFFATFRYKNTDFKRLNISSLIILRRLNSTPHNWMVNFRSGAHFKQQKNPNLQMKIFLNVRNFNLVNLQFTYKTQHYQQHNHLINHILHRWAVQYRRWMEVIRSVKTLDVLKLIDWNFKKNFNFTKFKIPSTASETM